MKFDIKEKFLELTEYNIPYGTENLLKNKLPKKIKQDEFGNYYIKIGKSKTLFTAHLDDASWGSSNEKVNHIIDNEWIRTDGSTVLGADDKAGVVILLYMIENEIPGTYYFFIGEESGMAGSKGILRIKRDWFNKFKRCISFDRRGYGSIISRQMGRKCCSDDFVNSLSEQFKINGMNYKNDPGGIYTDSAAFIGIIPECTNLSVGYFNEHSTNEHQNITYLEELCETCLKIEWENLLTSNNIKNNNKNDFYYY